MSLATEVVVGLEPIGYLASEVVVGLESIGYLATEVVVGLEPIGYLATEVVVGLEPILLLTGIFLLMFVGDRSNLAKSKIHKLLLLLGVRLEERSYCDLPVAEVVDKDLWLEEKI